MRRLALGSIGTPGRRLPRQYLSNSAGPCLPAGRLSRLPQGFVFRTRGLQQMMGSLGSSVAKEVNIDGRRQSRLPYHLPQATRAANQSKTLREARQDSMKARESCVFRREFKMQRLRKIHDSRRRIFNLGEHLYAYTIHTNPEG